MAICEVKDCVYQSAGLCQSPVTVTIDQYGRCKTTLTTRKLYDMAVNGEELPEVFDREAIIEAGFVFSIPMVCRSRTQKGGSTKCPSFDLGICQDTNEKCEALSEEPEKDSVDLVPCSWCEGDGRVPEDALIPGDLRDAVVKLAGTMRLYREASASNPALAGERRGALILQVEELVGMVKGERKPPLNELEKLAIRIGEAYSKNTDVAGVIKTWRGSMLDEFKANLDDLSQLVGEINLDEE